MFKDKNSLVYMILWELIYHYHIGINVAWLKGAFAWYKKWADYLFDNIDGPEPITINSPSSVGGTKEAFIIV